MSTEDFQKDYICLWAKLAFGKAFGNEGLCQKLPAAVKYDAARKFGSEQRS